MDLAFGTNVLEHGYSIGRLAGLDMDRRNHRVQSIVVSGDGTIGPAAETRPLEAVPVDHFSGDIALRAFPTTHGSVAPSDVLKLGGATRVMRNGRQLGLLTGVEVSPDTGEIVAIEGRQHWWTRRFTLPASALDFSVPGEIQAGASSSKAA